MNHFITHKSSYPLSKFCKPGDVAPYVLVPGSKARVRRFAQLWDKAALIFDYHEFLLYTGEYGGVPISACSSGIGGASVAVVVQELAKLGVHTMIRVGVTGALQANINVGDVIIASGAIRRDRVSEFYFPLEIPAISSHEVILALAAVCEHHKFTYHVGITATTGTFYCGEGRLGFGGYNQSWMSTIVEDLNKCAAVDWDTETATLFSLAGSLGIRAGRINGVLDALTSDIVDPKAEERAVFAGLDAIRILNFWDQKKSSPDEILLSPELPDREF